ncbi:d6a1c3b8-71d0-44be-a489-1483a1fe840d [Thermothielavioides terrestris]|uniref:D6a1c3b8-71d0-44be-a489-1483a1fe840d n=1 Tax=Thermothielavioides terrestris TaxID=2587410 RepID=A0A446BK74_9PEZI|nr:d6a1c3b8-71d0-44be-a489-1483a1fe840d [Thermothielavioides terrestris]
MRPAGVTSKNDMGDLKIAVAILSCNLRDTSMEQKIHRMRVCTTVSAAAPMPNTK